MGLRSAFQHSLAGQILDVLNGVNVCALKLAVCRSSMFRTYLSMCVRKYDDFAGHGLSARDPLEQFAPQDGELLSVPLRYQTGGGTDPYEMLTLASLAKLMRPRRVFEIGTYNGKSTSVFLLNVPEDSEVFTLDLPAGAIIPDDYLDSDTELVRNCRPETFLSRFKSDPRYHQIYCDSKDFDPEPFRDSIDLGFIDGAHTREFVQNDTEKMAVMMSRSGLTLWHDYGGKWAFRPLTEYLESLPIAMCRMPMTSLAWTTGSELKKLVGGVTAKSGAKAA